jgi:hypothetical protein
MMIVTTTRTRCKIYRSLSAMSTLGPHAPFRSRHRSTTPTSCVLARKTTTRRMLVSRILRPALSLHKQLKHSSNGSRLSTSLSMPPSLEICISCELLSPLSRYLPSSQILIFKCVFNGFQFTHCQNLCTCCPNLF